MIKHFAADGSVKREWPEGLHATPAVRDGKQITQVQGSNSVLAEIELGDGEQVGESFVSAIASALAAADVHPIETALTAPVAISPEEPTPQAQADPVTQADAERLQEIGINAVAEGSKLEVILQPDPAPEAEKTA